MVQDKLKLAMGLANRRTRVDVQAVALPAALPAAALSRLEVFMTEVTTVALAARRMQLRRHVRLDPAGADDAARRLSKPLSAGPLSPAAMHGEAGAASYEQRPVLPPGAPAPEHL